MVRHHPIQPGQKPFGVLRALWIGSSLLLGLPVMASAQTYVGNQTAIDASFSINISAALVPQASFRFTMPGSGSHPVTSVWFNAATKNNSGSTGTYTVSIQTDSAGSPSGVTLGGGLFTYPTSGSSTTFVWYQTPIGPITLTSGSVYHLVVDGAAVTGASSSKYLILTSGSEPRSGIYPFGQLADPNSNTVTFNGVSSWIPMNQDPCFVLQFNDASFPDWGDPYDLTDPYYADSTDWSSQVFKVPAGPVFVNKIGVFVSRLTNPADNLYGSLVNLTAATTLGSVTILEPSVNTYNSWAEAGLAVPVSLNASDTYQLNFSSPGSNATTHYYVLQGASHGLPVTATNFDDLTYQGTAGYAQYALNNPPPAWTPIQGDDLGFRMAVFNTFTPTQTYTPTVSPTPTVTLSYTPTATPSPTATCSAPQAFGHDIAGLFKYQSGGTGLNSTRFVLSQPGVVSRIALNVAQSGGGQVRVALYDESGAAPNALLTQSVAVAAVNGWNLIDVPSVPLAAGNYWLAWQGQNGVQVTHDLGPSGQEAYRSLFPFGSFPASYTMTASGTWVWSIYALYCPTGGSNPTPTATPSCTPQAFGNPFSLGTAATEWAADGNSLNSSKFVLSTGGYLSAMALRTESSSNSVRMAVYSDNAGAPQSLLAQSVTVAPNGEWVTVGMPNIFMPPGTYWLAFQAQAGNNVEFQTGSAGDEAYRSPFAYGAFPVTFGLSISGNTRWAITALLCSGTAPTPTPSGTPTATPSLTATASPTPTASSTASFTATSTATMTATSTPTNTGTSTATDTATKTATNSATATATNTASSTATDTGTNTATWTATNTATATASPTSTATFTASSTATNSPTNTATNSATDTATSTATNSATATSTATWTATNTATSSATRTATSTASSTATNSATNTATNSATATPTATWTATDSMTATPSLTATASPTPTATSTATHTATSTATLTATATATSSATRTPTNSATNSATDTPTPTATFTATNTATFTASSTYTHTPIFTSTPTATPSRTGTNTATSTPTDTATYTPSNTPTNSPTATPSRTPTSTATATNSATATATRTATATTTDTATRTATNTATDSMTATPSLTASASPTPTATRTATSTPTVTLTYTATRTPTDSMTATPSLTASASPTPTATRTATSTATVTLTYTATRTPTDSMTATPSPTATASPTPTATRTPTLTPTITNTPTITDTFTPTGSVTSTPTPDAALYLDANFFDPTKGSLGMDVRVDQAGNCKVLVFNIAGQQVLKLADQDLAAGNYRFYWDGTNEPGAVVGNGVYFVLVRQASGNTVKKVIVLK
ncbi:MAG TPA: FlgD immunoglobulin-like domain containing protein [bacterium]|nr:FlgD immunoglobulin-like domain containing protein [bacterium]